MIHFIIFSSMLSYWCVLLFNILHAFRTTIVIEIIIVKQNINENDDQLTENVKCLQEQMQKIRRVVLPRDKSPEYNNEKHV
jgi:D-ribose pyranose/furanose isomerase RbsD